MFDVQVWSDVSLNVQTVRASATTITAITKANPGVASSVGHGYVNTDILLLLVKGMRELNWKLVRVANKTADDYELEGVNTTNFHTFVSGTAEKLTFGASAATVTTLSPSGGEAAENEVSTIHNPQNFSIPGNFSALKYAMDNLWVPDDPALVALKAFGDAKTPCGVEIVFATGVKVYMAATPSFAMAPAGSAGNVVTTPGNLAVRGPLTTYAS